METMDSKLCRICTENDGVFPLYNANNEIQICDKIMYCCPRVNIIVGDGLPLAICSNCNADLTVAYNFVIRCESSDKALRSVPLFTVTEIKKTSLKPEIKLENYDQSSYDSFPDEPSDYIPLASLKDVKLEQMNYSGSIVIKKRKYKKREKHKKNVKDLICPTCSHQSPNKSSLIVHMKSHKETTDVTCSQCNKTYKSLYSLNRHIKKHENTTLRERNFICESCGKGFFKKNDVVVHMRTHTGETPYVCTECSARFTQISALQRHVRRHNGIRTHQCTECSKKFCTKEELKSHLNVHTTEKKFSCHICNIPFKYKNNLKKHIRVHSEQKRFVCNHCGKGFNAKGNLQTHIDRLHSNKSGVCKICSKNVKNIETHMWKHTGERPLKCELCTSSFCELRALAHHINFRHKKTDKFKCTEDGCGLSFPSHPMLKFHMDKVHGTGIPHPCDKCSRGFYRKNDLARHMLGTHKEKLV